MPGADFGDAIQEAIGDAPRDGETWAEAAERLRPDSTIDPSCPEGCFDLEVSGHNDVVDTADFLMEIAI